MTRFIALIVGLTTAALALYMLTQGSADSPAVSGDPRATTSADPLDEVDDASRAQLERVLREAEGDNSTRTPRE